MGYRDDFYVQKNIIGYTGTLRDNPTVYFFVGGASKTFGHITQVHSVAENVGRETVITDSTYKCGNLVDADGEYFYEVWSTGQHPSRNKMIWRNEFGTDDLALLAQSIKNCPDEKKLGRLAIQDREEAIRQGYGGAGTSPSVADVTAAYEAAIAANAT